MNQHATETPGERDQGAKHAPLSFKGAQVMWPLDCSDEMLEYAIQLARTYQETLKDKVQRDQTDYGAVNSSPHLLGG